MRYFRFHTVSARGFHHVNTKDSYYWIDIFKKNDFILNQNLTELVRRSSTIERNFLKDFGLFFENKKLTN